MLYDGKVQIQVGVEGKLRQDIWLIRCLGEGVVGVMNGEESKEKA